MSPKDIHEDRKSRNREIVLAYLDQTEGLARLTRHELFTEDGEGGLWTTETCEPIVIRGIDALREHAKWSLQCFPDWKWTNRRVFVCDDPDVIWVECDGRGKICFPGYPEAQYENHFLHCFELRDGKIVRNREFMNPIAQLRSLGIEVPKVKREGIPAS